MGHEVRGTIDPQFCDWHLLPEAAPNATSIRKREVEAAYDAWLKKASKAYYRWKVRYRYSDVEVASAGPKGPIADPQAEMDEFAARMLEARTLPDGSLIPPKDICAFDQTPVTREIVGRKTLRKKGNRGRQKVTSTSPPPSPPPSQLHPDLPAYRPPPSSPPGANSWLGEGALDVHPLPLRRR